MEILGIGIPELGLILLIIFLVMGPKDMVGTARRIARTVRALSHSEAWRTIAETWKMARDIPDELLRESGLDEARAELNKMNQDLDQWKREVGSDAANGQPPAHGSPAVQGSPAGPELPEISQHGADTDTTIPAHD